MTVPGAAGGLGHGGGDWFEGGIAQTSEHPFGASPALSLKLTQGMFERFETEVRLTFGPVQSVQKSGHVNQPRPRFQEVEIKQLLSNHGVDVDPDDRTDSVAPKPLCWSGLGTCASICGQLMEYHTQIVQSNSVRDCRQRIGRHSDGHPLSVRLFQAEGPRAGSSAETLKG